MSSISGVRQEAKRSLEPTEGGSQTKKQRTMSSINSSSVPYLVTTEVGQTEVLEALSQIPEKANGVYVGFSNEFNYNVIAIRKVKYAFICDIDEKMIALYAFIKKTVLGSPRREDFLKKFGIALREGELSAYSKLAERTISHYRDASFMWTRTDERYDEVRRYYLEDRITHIKLNLFEDGETLDGISQSVRRSGDVFDCVYVSNIPEWAVRSSWGTVETMKENLLKLVTRDTVFIDAKQEQDGVGAPKLRLKQGIERKKDLPSFRPIRRSKVPSQRSSGSLVARRLNFEAIE